MGSLLHGFLSGSIRFLSVAPKKLYHKIDLSPNPVFQRWRAYLKRWSVISSLSLCKSERTAYCRKNLHDNKTLNKPFYFPLHKRLRANVRNYPTSVRKRTLIKPADACKLNKGVKPLNYIYPHKA